MQAWLDWLRVERNRARGTIAAYERELRGLGAAGLGEIETLSSDALRRYLTAAGGAPSTVSKRVAAFRSFYGFLVRSGARSDDPSSSIDRPRVHRGLPRPVSGLSSLIASVDDVTRNVAYLLRETGLRISELCALEVPVPAPVEVVVLGKGRKERVIPLTDVARQALDELGGRVAWRPRTIQRRFKALGFTPHQLRHTCATELIASGADLGDVQKLLGHASANTTLIYAHYGTDRLRRALNRRREL